jgi:hypothetical protein
MSTRETSRSGRRSAVPFTVGAALAALALVAVALAPPRAVDPPSSEERSRLPAILVRGEQEPAGVRSVADGAANHPAPVANAGSPQASDSSVPASVPTAPVPATPPAASAPPQAAPPGTATSPPTDQAPAPAVSERLAERDSSRSGSGSGGGSLPLGGDAWSPLLDGAIGARRAATRELGFEELVRRVLRLRGSEEVALV